MEDYEKHILLTKQLLKQIIKNISLTESYLQLNNYFLSATERYIYSFFLSLFFINRAFDKEILLNQGWCETRTTESFESYYPKMIHSPSRFRANVPVSNMPEFAEAFQCPHGSAMIPEQRCIIW